MEKITSRKNEKIKFACQLKAADFRDSEGLLLAEGLRLCADAAENGVEIEACFLTEKMLEGKKCDNILAHSNHNYIIDEHIADKLADTKHPQGIFCICKKPQEKEQVDLQGKYIYLESIQDPGNLGTALRTAEAFGLSGAMLCGCCDAFSPKALRAAMGATFRLPLIADDNRQILQDCTGKGMNLYCAVVAGTAEDISIIRGKKGIIAAVGNEANGLSEEILAVGTPVTIHMAGRAESLNASQAATVVMYEMANG